MDVFHQINGRGICLTYSSEGSFADVSGVNSRRNRESAQRPNGRESDRVFDEMEGLDGARKVV